MNIQSAKIDLIKLILETDSPALLETAITLFESKGSSDFWHSLTPEQKEEVEQGIKEIENGETVDFETIMSKHRK
jgi:hypothetical protein